jgi:hypothetical protein
MPEPDRTPLLKRAISRSRAPVIARLTTDGANNEIRQVAMKRIRGDNKGRARLYSAVV